MRGCLVMTKARWAIGGLLVLVVQLFPFAGSAGAQSDACRVGQELGPGDYCTVDIPGIDFGGNRFEAQADGSALLGTSRFSRNPLSLGGFRASPIRTLEWRIDAVPGGGGTNRPPRPTGSIPAQTLAAGGAAASVNVARYFTDPDGDALTYSASSNRTGIVRASASGSTVTLTPVAAGTATVTVTARDPDGASATQSIAVTVQAPGGGDGRLPARDIDLDDENRLPRGIWSDGATLWVADREDEKLYAYALATGVRDRDKDVDTLAAAGNNYPTGIWSDGATMWVADWEDEKLYAYALATGARDRDKDIDALAAAGNNNPYGLWSDGVTLWVADVVDDKLYAYALATGVRDRDKDIDTLAAAGNTIPQGLWSDGATLWVAEQSDDKLYAYALATGVRDRDKDIDTLAAAGNNRPAGIWSDGATMATLWVADADDDKLYAYALPRAGGGANRPPRSVGSIPAQTLSVGGRAASVDVSRYFTDPDGDTLTYTARSSRTGIVTAAASGSTVTLTPVAAGPATVTVTARDPGGLSATQSIAVTVQAAGGVNGFTDDPLVPGVTPVRAVHFRELRTRIDALRTQAGLSAYAWTDPTLRAGVTGVRSVHLTELRTALRQAYDAGGQSPPAYSDAVVRAATTPIRASHITELRAAVVDLENAAPTGLMPDLVVGSPTVSDSTLTPGQSFTFSVTVRNRGSARAAATMLRYYRSANATISASDTEVGTDAVSALAAGASGPESIGLTAPSSAGTYYYGACVDPVSEESDTGNNCSTGVRVTVESGGGGQALTGEVTTCTGTRTVGTIVNVVIAGTVTARRAVSLLTLTGRANGDFVGIQFIGSMSAGQTESFRITGVISTSASSLRCEIDAEFRTSSGSQTGEAISMAESGPVR